MDESTDPRTVAILDWVDAFVDTPEAVPEQVRRTLADHLDEPQIVELTFALAAFLGFSKLRIALGLVPDDMDVRVVPTPDVAPDTDRPD